MPSNEKAMELMNTLFEKADELEALEKEINTADVVDEPTPEVSETVEVVEPAEECHCGSDCKHEGDCKCKGEPTAEVEEKVDIQE